VAREERPIANIYKNGIYAKTKIGDGVLVSDERVESLNSILSGDINILLDGLSKCFIPRHGFVYYNSENEPVASVSVCFECGQIKIWNNKEIQRKEIVYSKKSIAKAEKQIEYIKSKVVVGLLPVYDEVPKYKEYVAKSEDYNHHGEITITRIGGLDEFKDITESNTKSWFSDSSAIKIDVKEKYTGGGDKYEFKTIVYKKDSELLFEDNSENPRLIEAEIYNPEIKLPNGVSIGMSLDEILSTFTVYDGISTPEKIIVDSKDVKLEYYFSKHTLIKIKIYAY